MKRKLPLLMAMLLLVSVLCAPVAQAAYAPSPGGETEIDDPDIPLDELPTVRVPIVDADGSVSEVRLQEAVDQVNAGDAVRITVTPNGGVTTDRAKLTKEQLEAVKSADAELMVETSYGKMVVSASSLNSYDDEIVLVIRKELEELEAFGRGLGLKVYVLYKGGTYYNWSEPVTLYVPAVNGNFEVDNSYSVDQLNVEGTKLRDYTGVCVEGGDEKWVVITTADNYLGYFETQPGVVAENVAVADPTIVASPLASKTVTKAEAPSMLASVQHWFDSVANQIMKLFGI